MQTHDQGRVALRNPELRRLLHRGDQLGAPQLLALLAARACQDRAVLVDHVAGRVDGGDRGHRVAGAGHERRVADAARRAALAPEQLADGGAGPGPDGAALRHSFGGRLAGRVSLVGPGPHLPLARGQVVDDRRGDERHPPVRREVAALVLLEPADHAVGGSQPEGAAAREQDGVRLVGVGERPQRVGLPRSRPAAVHADPAARLRRRDHHRAPRPAHRVRPVPDRETVRQRHRFAHALLALRAGRFALRLGRLRSRSWQTGQK